MALQWFRLYRELKDDPKIGALNDAQFRCYIESLCWACEKGDGGNMGLTISNSSWAFRRNVSDSINSLLEMNLLGLRDDGQLYVPAWERRQFKSDSSYERVKKYRGKQDETLSETLQKRPCNGLDTDTDTEKNREEEAFNDFWSLYPNKVAKPKAKLSFLKAIKNYSQEVIMAGLRRHLTCEQWTKDGGKFIPHPTTWLNQERFNDLMESEQPKQPKPLYMGRYSEANPPQKEHWGADYEAVYDGWLNWKAKQ